jgi:hypothetical protein
MNFSIKDIISFLPALLFISPAFSQEILIFGDGNQQAGQFYNLHKAGKKSFSSDTLDPPFLDDFSNTKVIPDQTKWSDNFAFINNKYPVFPITAGVATLDAYNYDGSHYPNAGSSPYYADFLTSQSINLDLLPADSIYLSFFYQAKGLGEKPETQDSLCLEFYKAEHNLWTKVWAIPGEDLHDFKLIMIPVKNPDFLKKGFRFRFYNIASQTKDPNSDDLKSDVDHWHLDYIYLNKNRHVNDTVFRDVAFVTPVTSILKDYETVPWKHLELAQKTQRKTYINTLIRNNDNITRNVTRSLIMTDLTNSFTYKPTPTSNDIAAGDSVIHLFAYDYPFDYSMGDSSKFLIRTIIQTDVFDYKANDTLEYIQNFKNYYAFDDGSSEAGYGIRGSNTSAASSAIKFECFEPDSLRAVDFYFNQVLNDLNLENYFYLRVWDDNDGKPGNLIYSQIGLKPEYGNGLNQFIRYPLDSVISLNGIFYLGYTKTREEMLNIGFDLNRNNSSRNFYNLGSEWENSKLPGALMIRPVVSKTPLLSKSSDFKTEQGNILIYPNPANEILQIKIENFYSSDYAISIYDITGKIVIQSSYTSNEQIYTGNLKDGLYMLLLVNTQSGERTSHKLIIRH